MAPSVEVLSLPTNSVHSRQTSDGIARAAWQAGSRVTKSKAYQGASDILVIYGVGAPASDAARRAHVASGRHVAMWDLGYFGPKKTGGYFRVSIDHDHPQALLDRTPNDPMRWDAHGIELRDDAGDGPILLIGLGAKSRAYLNATTWEHQQLEALKRRFPGRRIVHRPKPGRPPIDLPCETDATTPIEVLLRGASLVVCRHSNVAVDAAIAGVTFECEDGAAIWLRDKPYTKANRLDFLHRLAHWQWKASESSEAWQHILRMTR